MRASSPQVRQCEGQDFAEDTAKRLRGGYDNHTITKTYTCNELIHVFIHTQAVVRQPRMQNFTPHDRRVFRLPQVDERVLQVE